MFLVSPVSHTTFVQTLFIARTKSVHSNEYITAKRPLCILTEDPNTNLQIQCRGSSSSSSSPTALHPQR